jgi:WD40 repeat protein
MGQLREASSCHRHRREEWIAMRTYLTCVALLVLLACLLLCLPTRQRNVVETPPTPVSWHGDDLPPGAVVRLGSLRLVHLGGPSAVAVSPDSRVVASGLGIPRRSGFLVNPDEQKALPTIRLWDADKGTLLRELPTPEVPVSCLRFAPDGRTLFAGCGRYVCAWNAETGKQLWQKEGVPGVRFDDGFHAERLLVAGDKLIALLGGRVSGHDQLGIYLWDAATGMPLPTPKTLQSTLTAEGHIATLFQDVAISPDGKFAAVQASRADVLTAERHLVATWKYTERRLLVIDLTTGEVRHTLPDNEEVVQTHAAFSFFRMLPGPCLAFSPDGDTLAVSAAGEITLLQIASGRKRVLAKGLPERLPLAFVDATQLAAQLGDGKVRAWDIGQDREIDPEPVHSQAFLRESNGQLSATIHGNTVSLTDLRTGKAVPAFEGHRGTPSVRFSPHSRDVLLSSEGWKAYKWDTGNWKPEPLPLLPGRHPLGYFLSPGALDVGVSWEKGLYVRADDDRLELWDFQTGQLVHPLLEPLEPPFSVTFCASGDRLLVGTKGESLVLDVRTGKVLARLPPASEVWPRLSVPEISPRGTYVALTRTRESIGLYEASSGKFLRTLAPSPMSTPEKREEVFRFYFSPDEKTLFGEMHQLLAEDGFSDEKVTVTLWDIPTGDFLQEVVVDPHYFSFWRRTMTEALVRAMALSPDRRLVALARTGAKEIEVWETASGTKRGVLAGHEGPVVSLSFSADSKLLASGSEDTTVLVWDLHRPLQAVEAKKRLTADEVATHWKTMERLDAPAAERAVWALTWAVGDAVPLLKEHLRPVAHVEAGRLARLLADLDSDDFDTRDAAANSLEGLGEQVVDDLQKAAEQKNSLEKQRRLEALLSTARDARPFGTAEKVRQWRALEVLEKAATPEAVGLLTDLAGGAPGARLTREARAALDRLAALTKGER